MIVFFLAQMCFRNLTIRFNIFSPKSYRKSALECVESMYGKYATLTENLRNSDYLISLPPLPVSCVELDGDARFVYIYIYYQLFVFVYNLFNCLFTFISTMPVIYEDVYKDDESSNLESAKRRHSFSK